MKMRKSISDWEVKRRKEGVSRMDEYICREDAKDALQEKVFHNLTDEFYGAMQVIDEMPSADVVQVVHGKWINTAPRHRSDNIICDHCGYDSIAAYRYCPY